jgi:hypothetical protein
MLPVCAFSRQIEQQNFRVLRPLDSQPLFFADSGTIALTKFLPVQFNLASGNLHPSVPLTSKAMSRFLAGRKQTDE